MWHVPPSVPLGPAALPSLPLALLVALLVWPPVATVYARRLGVDSQGVSIWATWLTVAMLLGSRLALLIAYPGDFFNTPRALITAGGSVARWGMIAGLVAACGWLIWRRRGEAWRWLEAVFIAAPLPLAVVAAGWSDPGAVPALLGLSVSSAVLMSSLRPPTAVLPKPGQAALAALLLMCIVGFALPWFRLASPDTVTVWPGWTAAQWAFLVVGVGAAVGVWLRD